MIRHWLFCRVYSRIKLCTHPHPPCAHKIHFCTHPVRCNGKPLNCIKITVQIDIRTLNLIQFNSIKLSENAAFTSHFQKLLRAWFLLFLSFLVWNFNWEDFCIQSCPIKWEKIKMLNLLIILLIKIKRFISIKTE